MNEVWSLDGERIVCLPCFHAPARALVQLRLAPAQWMSSAVRGNRASRAPRRLSKRRMPCPTELQDLMVFEDHR